MKSLYFMRHGIAVKKSSMLYEDKDRPLTEDGIKRLIEEAKGLAKFEGSFDLILYSPLKRASQTATVITNVLRCKNKMEVCNELAPNVNFSKLVTALAKYTNKKRILLVGHEPDLSIAIGMFLGLNNFNILLKKGAICRIDIKEFPPDSSAQMIWLMQPKALKMLGGKK